MADSTPASSTSSPTISSAARRARTARHFSFDGVGLSYPGHRVLTDVTFTVPAGSRTGLIGENGAGKSTLLRIAAGQLAPDAGTVRRPAGTGYLAQESIPAPAATLGEAVEAAVAPVRRLEPALAQLAAQLGRDPEDAAVAQAYDLVLTEAERAGLWALEARIATVLAGLGLAEVPLDRPLRRLSGGQRRRLALAVLLLERPEALLLDEPTNHLDDDAVGFLAAELRGWTGPVLMASHDRWFLDEIATHLVDLDPSPGPEGYGTDAVQGRRYTGGFSAYLRERAEERRRWAEAWRAQQTERARLRRAAGTTQGEVFHTDVPRTEARGAQKFYADRAAKTVGGRIRSARQALAALERQAVPPPPVPLRFRGADSWRGVGTAAGPESAAARPDGLSDAEEPLLLLSGAGLRNRLEPLDLVLHPGDRLLVEGANGYGKSTLLAVLAGELFPDAGTVQRRPGLKVGWLRQDGEAGLLADLTAEEAYRRRLRLPDRAPSLPDLGLLPASRCGQPLGRLSPGQRRRVALAPLLAEPPELLLLDEPTNHLSLALAEELESALDAYPGAVVLTSHDRWLRRRWDGPRIGLRRG
ncbi:putative ABC transporter ATP-binding protein YheS [Arthrobacter saudimassiliensis]|uniref:Putative ABC transporter ATP-binding protein YheS n=1 Tax=Arthrobacter saudimassiliensis TaxID=1461584 RepID=A0A078MLT7_9MICC|nr:putative ABC transporter ATP-binding protein YheS [Arthrobacter saudimassiliensis]